MTRPPHDDPAALGRLAQAYGDMHAREDARAGRGATRLLIAAAAAVVVAAAWGVWG